jgi:hypothetical protein
MTEAHASDESHSSASISIGSQPVIVDVIGNFSDDPVKEEARAG